MRGAGGSGGRARAKPRGSARNGAGRGSIVAAAATGAVEALGSSSDAAGSERAITTGAGSGTTLGCSATTGARSGSGALTLAGGAGRRGGSILASGFGGSAAGSTATRRATSGLGATSCQRSDGCAPATANSSTACSATDAATPTSSELKRPRTYNPFVRTAGMPACPPQSGSLYTRPLPPQGVRG